MKRNILIIEDDQSQMNMLKNIVEKMDADICIFTANNIKAAYYIAMENRIDCFMVDIILDTNEPGDTSGMRFVENIRKFGMYFNTPVFFITSLEDPSNYAYKDLHCIDYIEKPFDAHRIKKGLRQVLQIPIADDMNKGILFRKDGILYPIKCGDIIYIETKNHSVHINMCDGDCFVTQYRPCKDILDEAGVSCLIQCNRSTIINMHYIENIDLVNKYITMKNCTAKLEIGITFKKKILGFYER